MPTSRHPPVNCQCRTPPNTPPHPHKYRKVGQHLLKPDADPSQESTCRRMLKRQRFKPMAEQLIGFLILFKHHRFKWKFKATRKRSIIHSGPWLPYGCHGAKADRPGQHGAHCHCPAQRLGIVGLAEAAKHRPSSLSP